MTDEELKKLIQRQMHLDAGNPYFIKKVLNRLPKQQKHTHYLWFVRCAYLAATVILCVFWLRLILFGEMFGKNILDLLALWSLTLLVCFMLLQKLTQKLA